MPSAQYAREIPQRYRMEAARCASCRTVTFPPGKICPRCRSRDFEKVTLADEGKLVTWTVIHVAPERFAIQTPYVVGIVELDHGIRVTAQIVDCDPEELELGQGVRRTLRRIATEGRGGIIHYGYKFVLARP